MPRYPAVAGQFYPESPAELKTLLDELIPAADQAAPARGVVVPHAGYVYSGAIAGKIFAAVDVPKRVVVLGPNHSGAGSRAAVSSAQHWQTPLGECAVDREAVQSLLAACPLLVEDELAFRREHSQEVQVPFIQARQPDAKIVPICLGHLAVADLLILGKALAEVLATLEGDTLIVASSDMTHYESGARAREKDMLALQKVLDLDPEGLFETVCEHRITMCGVYPVMVMLAAARLMGSTKAELIHYGNSGDVTGDQSEVVGYAGVVVR